MGRVSLKMLKVTAFQTLWVHARPFLLIIDISCHMCISMFKNSYISKFKLFSVFNLPIAPSVTKRKLQATV